jgi:beta-lactamase superfamily II metal-dependent hydrolase
MISMPTTVTVSDFSIDIHVMGSGYGEGIIVVIGKKRFFGADSCPSLINSTSEGASYVEQVIQSMGRNPLMFWTLTHFHYDHFAGLAWILRKFSKRIRALIVPENYTSKDIAESVRRHARSDSGSDAAYYVSGKEYEELISACSSSPIETVKCRASPHYRIVDVDVRTRAGLSRRLVVDVIGAAADDMTGVIARQIPKAFGSAAKHNRAAANFGSYILVISMGDFRGVLFGDAPASRTRALPWSRTLGRWGASFVKVAHHGATDGTTGPLLDRLIGRIGSKHGKIAIVTPFRMQGLPRAEVLQLLEKKGFEVKISGDHGTKGSLKRAIEQDFGADTILSVDSAISPEEAVIVSKFSCD